MAEYSAETVMSRRLFSPEKIEPVLNLDTPVRNAKQMCASLSLITE
ncbi:hypothetical protein Tchar_02689 [Tepidimonas charontis]|uniref:Uncharacterized protein n=1 Tax=Tepidimonas charontis TaxID=2267262 RepID=A0A554WXD1_9BURK|nr:hypothetical protein Tchar_02689 [Tepidimonas charontis]